MVEDTVLKTMTEDGKEEKEVEILAEGVKAGENIQKSVAISRKILSFFVKEKRFLPLEANWGLWLWLGERE